MASIARSIAGENSVLPIVCATSFFSAIGQIINSTRLATGIEIHKSTITYHRFSPANTMKSDVRTTKIT